MPKKSLPVGLQPPPAIPVTSYPPHLFQPPADGWEEWAIRHGAECYGIPESVFRGFKGPYDDSQQLALLKLAQKVDDCDTFLALAKAAWTHVHWMEVQSAPRDIKKRGRAPVKEQCLAAIKAGHEALGLPAAEFWMDGESGFVYRNDNYQRLPLGRLKQMILERVPSVSPSAAKKFARLWDRQGIAPEPDRRVLGMKLSQKVKNEIPELYKRTLKPRTSSDASS